MLQDEAFHFVRLGTFLERADNTARLLDVKFHARQQRLLRHRRRATTSEYDFYHWSGDPALSVSAFEVYRKVYRDVIQPERVAELLILRADMPRSLHALHERMVQQPAQRGQRPVRARRCAAPAAARPTCSYGRIDEILATGLHAYLTQFLANVDELGVGISRDFLVTQ